MGKAMIAAGAGLFAQSLMQRIHISSDRHFSVPKLWMLTRLWASIAVKYIAM
jgi:hypothetical protein